MTIALYRYFDDSTLLYVGISKSPMSRMIHHSKRAKWWPRATSVTFEHYGTREQAENAERIAIRDEMPEFNVSGSPAWAYPQKRMIEPSRTPVPFTIGSDDRLDQVFGVTDAAHFVHISSEVIAGAMRSGALHGWKVSSQWRVHARCLNDWMNGRACEHQADGVVTA
jgi:hypothetical protein